LLPQLFTKIWIPGAVVGELRHERTHGAVRRWAEQLPSWIEAPEIAGTASEHELAGLDRGEWEAIQLAKGHRGFAGHDRPQKAMVCPTRFLQEM
jgi:predicted nucleic acid-binding protein